MDENTGTNEDQWDEIYSAFSAANAVKFGHRWGMELLEASRNGDVERVREIIAMPVETGGLLLLRFSSRDEKGNTALHLAARAGHLEIVRLLVEVGLNSQNTNQQDFTPFALAKKSGHEEIVEYLSGIANE